ncbi:ketol-acid reductoisomerase [Fluviispira multicolorata]|uniref:Ketol-acid reductoisomerase n=1 Tax=Fluviispira multicolorata TaxID=2654512 RepID=A0A833N720_9BACT|nr:ketol-acid reductoisomerase [Fluviispira multicolorata]KAB8031735.1 ketol-acid reductoisomerase [Fluviispira multicolorata]
MSKLKFSFTEETVFTREEFSLEKAKNVLKDEVIAVIGYGVQGPAQALNLKDNGFNVIIGQRKNSSSWDKAIEDGWEPGKNLFSIEEACKKGSFISYLLSDAAQMQMWNIVREYLTPGKTLCFSHGFSVTYSDKTGVIPPQGIDVVLVAPKGSGRSVRTLFKEGKGINSSYAIHQDASKHAEEKALAYGIGVGSGYLFQTNFKHEVYSDLCGERGVLMGALAGIIAAQYEVLRENGHSPSEAFNETVEELTQSLVPLISENGMDWMFKNCSTTAQRGALDWMPRFKKATLPVFNSLYKSVASGEEARIVISANSKPDYKECLEKELDRLHNEEIWQVGKTVRKLRP